MRKIVPSGGPSGEDPSDWRQRVPPEVVETARRELGFPPPRQALGFEITPPEEDGDGHELAIDGHAVEAYLGTGHFDRLEACLAETPGVSGLQWEDRDFFRFETARGDLEALVDDFFRRFLALAQEAIGRS